MLRLVIVDDEPDVAAGMRTVVDWRRLGIEVVGDARDGAEGLELIRRARPDILMTDIRMPGMDGLALIESARRLMPELAALVFTGYSEFRYAKTAISLGVTEYLQKPVSVEAVEAALAKTAARAAEGRLLRRSRETETGRRLRGILEAGSAETAGLEPVLREAGIDPEGAAGTVVALVRVEPALADQVEEPFREDAGRMALLRDGSDLLLVAVGGAAVRADALSRLERAAASCGADGAGVLAGVGGWHEGIQGAGASFREALEALRYAGFARKGPVVLSEQLEFARAIPASVRGCEEALLGRIRDGAEGGVAEEAERFLSRLRGCGLSPDALRHGILSFVFRLLRMAEETGRDYLAENPGDPAPHRAVSELEDAEEVDRWALGKIRDIARWIVQGRRDGVHRSIRVVSGYLREHYDRDVTLRTLADLVGMNPSYLSVLFKRETGVTYQRFLTDLRIEAAKRLLDGGAKAWEAGRAVGYYSFRHFAQVFRKSVGATPFEYRSRARRTAAAQNSSTQSPPSSQ